MGRLKITIYPDGYVNAETVGIKGKKCDEYKPLLERILQNRVIEEDHTDEYYEKEVEYEWTKNEVKLNEEV